MPRRMLHLAGAVLFMAVSFALSVPAAQADDVGSLLGLVNTLRLGRGVTPLAADPTLTATARQWSAHMAATGTLAHNPSLTTQVPSGWSKLGENVGMGGSVLAVFNALVADPPHLANMIDPAFNHIGVAVVSGRGSLWITQDFEALAGGDPPNTPAPQQPATRTAPPAIAAPSPPPSTAPTQPTTTTPSTVAPVISTTAPTPPVTVTVTVTPTTVAAPATTSVSAVTTTTEKPLPGSGAMEAVTVAHHPARGVRSWEILLIAAAGLAAAAGFVVLAGRSARNLS